MCHQRSKRTSLFQVNGSLARLENHSFFCQQRAFCSSPLWIRRQVTILLFHMITIPYDAMIVELRFLSHYRLRPCVLSQRLRGPARPRVGAPAPTPALPPLLEIPAKRRLLLPFGQAKRGVLIIHFSDLFFFRFPRFRT